MEEYIKLSTVLDILNECRCSDCTNDKPQPCRLCQFQDFYTKLMKDGQTTKIAEQTVGKWIHKHWRTEDDWGGFNHRSIECSVCKIEIYKGEPTGYCPHCGASMSKE